MGRRYYAGGLVNPDAHGALIASYVAILVQMPDPSPLLQALSLLYYFALSFYLSGKMLKARHPWVN